MMDSAPQLLASGLRAVTLASRFALMFFLARSVSLEVLGLFGLYWAALQLATTVLPLDVYAQTTRLILDRDANQRRMVALHLGTIILALFIMSPLATWLFFQSSEKMSLLLTLLFMIHLVMETIASEIGRLLPALGRPLASVFILFMRSASWVPILIVVLETSSESVAISSIVVFWMSGSLIGVVLALILLPGGTGGTPPLPKFDLSWSIAALRASGLFFLATVIFRSIVGLDRFVVERLFDLETVGIYALYASVSLGVLGLIESGISAWRYPSLVAALQNLEIDLAIQKLSHFFLQNTIASVLLMSSIALIFPLACHWFLEKRFIEEILAFYIIVGGVFLYCISMPFHYVIYGFRRDKVLLCIYFLSLVSMLVWAVGPMTEFGLVGAGIMLSIALASIALLRFICAFVLLRNAALRREY